MPRRHIIKAAVIWERRASNYEKYYALHTQVMQETDSYRKIMFDKVRHIPFELDIFGGLDTDKYRKELNQTDIVYSDYAVPWIWSEEHWQRYVDMFNALVYISTDWELKYDAGTDSMYYVPIEGSVPRTPKVQPEYKVSTTRYNYVE